MSETELQSTLFGLLRHGQTLWNAEKRIQGSGNSELTPAGIAASRMWGRYLLTSGTDWNRIICSPLQRARETAELVNEVLQLPLQQDEGIREQNWGDWEGRTIEEIKRDNPGQLHALVRDGWEFRPPGGESRSELLARVLDSLRNSSVRWPQENLLVISHLGVIKSLLYHIDGRNFLPQEPKIVHKNRFYTIGLRQNTFSIINRNITLPDIR